MSKDVPATARADGGAAAEGAGRCACGAELAPLHDPFGPGDPACASCRDRGVETQRAGMAVRGIDKYGP